MERTAVVCPHCRRDWRSGVSHLGAVVSHLEPDAASEAVPSRSLPLGVAIAGVYLIVVAVCVIGSSGPQDQMPSKVVEPILIYLTLPLSFPICFLFAWSLIHGGPVAPMLAMLALSGFINAFLIVWGVDRLSRADARRRANRLRDESRVT